MVVDSRKVDVLISESRRIRDELMRTVGRLDAFTQQLAEEVAKLNNATGDSDE